MQLFGKASSLLFASVLIPMLTNCKGEKNTPEVGEIYPIPSCPEGQYFSGSANACTAKLVANAVTGFDSFRNVAFDARATTLASYITTYASQNLAGYTFEVAPTCVEQVEYNPSMNNGYYAAKRDISYDCSFKLLDDTGAVALEYVAQNTSTATVVDSTATPPTEIPEYPLPVLKIVQDVDSDRVSLKECSYEATAARLDFETDGKYDPEKEITTLSYYPVQVACSDFGTTTAAPSSLEGKAANLVAFPFSFNSYLQGERTNDFVTGTTPVYTFAANSIPGITTAPVTCSGTTFNFTLEFTPNPRSPAEGQVKVSNVVDPNNTAGTDFFATTTLLDVAGVNNYQKSRSILGCKDRECLSGTTESPVSFSYKFHGNYLAIEGGTREVWEVTSPTTLAFAATRFGAPADAPVCEFTYTNLGKAQ